MDLLLDYPLWFVLICLVAGFVFALALYYKDRRSDYPPWLNSLLAILRFVAVSIIAFLLMGPLLMRISKTYDRPVVIYAQDDSRSVLLGSDSLFLFRDYLPALDEVMNSIREEYELQRLNFGPEVEETDETNFDEKLTDISALIHDVQQNYDNRNIGALFIASDGLYNQGVNPVYAARAVDFPVYTVAMGDTSLKKDVRIEEVVHNKIAFEQNEFPVEVMLASEKCKNESLTVKLVRNGKTLASRNVKIDREDFMENIRFMLKAGQSGLVHYEVQVSVLDGEVSSSNNKADFFIDVIDAKSHILILADAPHPDIAAIRSALEQNEPYSLEWSTLNQFSMPDKTPDLLILHQLPSSDPRSLQIVTAMAEKEVPMLIVVGSQTDLLSLNELKPGIEIFSDNRTFENVYPSYNDAFSLFQLPDALLQQAEQLPPLFCPFGSYQLINSSQVLFHQKIGKVVTENPLVAFMSTASGKTAVICGEGIWRWRISSYRMNESHQQFNELIGKMVQYLVLKADKSRFHVYSDNVFFTNEDVVFRAELYNKNYELINDPEVNIMITDQEGNQYPYIFSKQNERYYLSAGNFPPGTYSYLAGVEHGGEAFTEKGTFVISRQMIEDNRLQANHSLLNRIASEHDGNMLYPGQIRDIPELLDERDDLKPVVYFQQKYSEIINFFWILALIILLLAVEWFLRRWGGSY